MSIKAEVLKIFPNSQMTAWKPEGTNWFPRSLSEARDNPDKVSKYFVMVPFNNTRLMDRSPCNCRQFAYPQHGNRITALSNSESEAWEKVYVLAQDHLVELLAG